MYYYVALISRSHAFLLERRLKHEKIRCELTYMPREVVSDLCNLGVRFDEIEMCKAENILRKCGLPGCRIYKEVVLPKENQYYEIVL